LYGIYEARQRPGRPEEILVVEGYMDAVALAQHGIEPALATLGTATTADHVRQLTRLANRVIFCFDGDRAGRAAAWRAAETALPFGGGSVEIKFLLLPEGEDPDSLVRKQGADDFRRRIPEALGLSTFLLHELGAQVDLGTSDGRAKLITLVKPLLERLPEGVYRELLADELAAHVGMSSERFKAVLQAPAATRPKDPPRPRTGNRSLIRKIITMIVHYPAAAGRVGLIEGLDDIQAPGAELLRRLLEMTTATPNLIGAQLIEAFRDDPEGRYLQRLAAEVPLDDEAKAEEVLADSLKRLVARHRQMAGAEALRRRAATPGSQDPGGV